MKRSAPLGSRFGAVFAFAVVFLLVATALRIAFAFNYRASSDAGPAVLARAFAAGFVYDVAALAWLALPACLLTAVTPAFRPRGPGRAAAHAVFGIAVFGCSSRRSRSGCSGASSARASTSSRSTISSTPARSSPTSGSRTRSLPLLARPARARSRAVWLAAARALAASCRAPAPLRGARVGGRARFAGSRCARLRRRRRTPRRVSETATRGSWRRTASTSCSRRSGTTARLRALLRLRGGDGAALDARHELLAEPRRPFVSDDPPSSSAT